MKRSIPWLMLSVSALSFSVALIWSTYFFWLVFIFLIPIYYCAYTSPLLLHFGHGLWWGALFWFSHFYYLLLIFHEKGRGNLKFLAIIIAIFVFALHSGLWFGITRRLLLLFKKNLTPLRVSIAWLTTTILYFYWTRYAILWSFGCYMGYPFSSPLTVLAEQPKLLYALATMGENILLIALVVSQMGWAYGLAKRSYRGALVAICCLMMFAIGLILPVRSTHVPDYVKKIGYIIPPSRALSTHEQAVEINKRIIALLQKNPEINTIITPELTFVFRLNMTPASAQLMCNNLPIKKVNIILGAIRKDGDNLYNTLYWLQDGQILHYYDKTVLMPFFEYVTFPWNKLSCAKELFLIGWNGFAFPKESVQIFDLDPTLSIVPRICSELYFGSDAHNFSSNPNHTSLFATSNNPFSTEYIKNLMCLFAVFKAMQTQRDILYTNCSEGKWISKDTGRAITLTGSQTA